MTTWHKGPPPSIGWWPASSCRDPQYFRWWNGKNWSIACTKNDSTADAAMNATYPARVLADYIEWTERPASWPERSRT
jgi:hypothetical protein